jgi:peroxiredoxin Q/BCP
MAPGARGAVRAAPTSSRGGRMLNPGDKAPDFTGRDHDGNTVKLSDYKGKTVVLWFYPKADTPG